MRFSAICMSSVVQPCSRASCVKRFSLRSANLRRSRCDRYGMLDLLNASSGSMIASRRRCRSRYSRPCSHSAIASDEKLALDRSISSRRWPEVPLGLRSESSARWTVTGRTSRDLDVRGHRHLGQSLNKLSAPSEATRAADESSHAPTATPEGPRCSARLGSSQSDGAEDR